MKEKIARFFGLCKCHRNITSASILTIGLIASPIAYKTTGSIWVVLYLAAIFVPLILGLMDRVKFKWVLLWEGIVLLPITIIAMLFFGGFLLALFRKA